MTEASFSKKQEVSKETYYGTSHGDGATEKERRPRGSYFPGLGGPVLPEPRRCVVKHTHAAETVRWMTDSTRSASRKKLTTKATQ